MRPGPRRPLHSIHAAAYPYRSSTWRSGLSGTVILERGQYLHLGFDLRVTEGSRSWVVNEVRRVKTNERQYFDHPAVGIIALVTPAG